MAYYMPSSAAASSEYVGFEADNKVYDSDPATYWNTDLITSWPVTLSLTLASAEVADTYTLTPHWTTALRAPTAWTFEGYNGSTWDVLDTQSGVTWGSSAEQVFTCSNTTAYISYQLNITANEDTGLTTPYTKLAEFWLTVPPACTLGGGGTLTAVGVASLTATRTFSGGGTLVATGVGSVDLGTVTIAHTPTFAIDVTAPGTLANPYMAMEG